MKFPFLVSDSINNLEPEFYEDTNFMKLAVILIQINIL